MKVPRDPTHTSNVDAIPRTPGLPAAHAIDWHDFRAVYDRYFHEVERWLRAMGIPPSEREDVAQEAFLVVRRKLAAFDGRNLAGWLFRITERTASDHRRRSWFRRFWRRGHDDVDRLEWAGAGPAESLERMEAQRRLARVLARMSEKRRTALVLFEIEGYSGEEIAAILDIPVATVWTRLHHARKEFLDRVAALDAEDDP